MRKTFLSFVILCAFVVHADTWTDPETGYTWTYRINGDTVELHKDPLGGGILPQSVISSSTTGPVTIPSVLDGKPVTSIGNYSEKVRDGVTSIGEGALYGCSGLKSVTIPDSVTSIGGYAFSGCNGIKDVTVSQCVCTDRMSSVFSSAYQAITNVVISDSVTSIGDQAFKDCSRLTNVTVPESVTSIGDEAFYNCSSLTHLTIPENVTSYGANCFEGCPAFP